MRLFLPGFGVTDATSFKVTTHQFLWGPVYRGVHPHQSTSYYAGLSFKSGYQQTGYIHPILSYYDVKYYYCLELGAGQALYDAGCMLRTTNNLTREPMAWALRPTLPHRFSAQV